MTVAVRSSAVEANRDQLARSAPFDLRRPHGIRHGWRAARGRHENAGRVDPRLAAASMPVTQQAPSEDLGELTKVFLSAAWFLGFLLLVALGAAVVWLLGAIRHWYGALAIAMGGA
jgi:hypothetical protein